MPWGQSLVDDLAALICHDLAAEETRVLDIEHTYLQWELDYPGTLVVELRSNRYLEPDHPLTRFDERRLLAAGFDAPTDERPNWTTWVADEAEARAVAASAVTVLLEAYRVSPTAVAVAIREAARRAVSPESSDSGD